MDRSRRTVKLITALVVAVSLGPVWAQRGDDTNRLSKNGRTEGSIEGVDVTIEYGRPSVKDRVIWGGLVPYGRVWRTGADEATIITLGDDVLIGGELLPGGQYSLFTIPGEEEWTIVFNQVAQQWGSFNYDESKDALRVVTQSQPSEFTETLEIEIDDSDVILRWAELAVPFSVSVSE